MPSFDIDLTPAVRRFQLFEYYFQARLHEFKHSHHSSGLANRENSGALFFRYFGDCRYLDFLYFLADPCNGPRVALNCFEFALHLCNKGLNFPEDYDADALVKLSSEAVGLGLWLDDWAKGQDGDIFDDKKLIERPAIDDTPQDSVAMFF